MFAKLKGLREIKCKNVILACKWTSWEVQIEVHTLGTSKTGQKVIDNECYQGLAEVSATNVMSKSSQLKERTISERKDGILLVKYLLKFIGTSNYGWKVVLAQL